VNARLFEELRPVGFAVAYRMLGSVSEAEDIVQEAFLRLHHTLQDGERIESPRAYLSTVVTRLCIDHLRSARARRETYVEALPEPLVGEAGAAVPLVSASGPAGVTDTGDPASHAEMADSLSLAFLVVLESLSPEQRAVFLLRDVFDYPYDRVAEIVGKSEAAVRQLAVRARRHVEDRRPRYETSRDERDELARRFLAAAQEGDVGALESLLAQDVVLHGDGGGKAPAIARPLHGASRVARTFTAWVKAAGKFGVTDVRLVDVNGQPGLLVVGADHRPLSAMAFDIAEGRIQSINSVVNPDKLRHLTR
jgi:RNA polymerase sigma-70 factor (TIGR02957 family)